MIDSKKDEWMKAQENVLEEGNSEQQSDDEISLTYLTGSDIPGSVDEVRSKTSESRLATLRPHLHKSHSHNLRSTTFSSLKVRSSPRLIKTKPTEHVSECTVMNKPVGTKLRRATNKINMQVQAESKNNSSSLVSKSQQKCLLQKLSTMKPPKAVLSRQTKFSTNESSCARVIPLSVACTKASTAARYLLDSTHTSYSPVSSCSTPSFSVFSPTPSNGSSSEVNTSASFSPSISAFYSAVENDKASRVRCQAFSSSSSASSFRPSQQLRTAAGPSKIPGEAGVIRRRCESGSSEFSKPIASSSIQHLSLPGIRVKPTLGVYERPRLCLRKRGDSRSAETESSTSDMGAEKFSQSG